MNILQWHEVCTCEDIEEDDVIEFAHEGKAYAVYHTSTGFYSTDGFCTHETARLAQGFVFDGQIECPMHMGRFDIATGKAQGAPVCVNLTTHPVKTERGVVWIGLEAE